MITAQITLRLSTLVSHFSLPLRKWFNKATRKAKILDFRFHDLRACYCTNALLNGWSIAEVASTSGHQDWSQLKRYTRIKPKDLLVKINNVVNLKSQ